MTTLRIRAGVLAITVLWVSVASGDVPHGVYTLSKASGAEFMGKDSGRTGGSNLKELRRSWRRLDIEYAATIQVNGRAWKFGASNESVVVALHPDPDKNQRIEVMV
jgi:hypothetical protein